MLKNISTKLIMALGLMLLIAGIFTSSSVSAAPVNPAFNDDNFYNCVIDRLNAANVDGVNDRVYTYNATDGELLQLTSLDCNSYGKADPLKIVSAMGLSKMANLTSLNLQSNLLAVIDITSNTALDHLTLSYNQLTAIDMSENTALDFLNLQGNQLTTIDLLKNAVLGLVFLEDNYLTSIDVSNNIDLWILALENNKLTNLDITKNIDLAELYLLGNSICTLDVTQNTLLTPENIQWEAVCPAPEVIPEVTPEATPAVVPAAPNTAIQRFILANPVIVAALGITTAAAIFMAVRRQLGNK